MILLLCYACGIFLGQLDMPTAQNPQGFEVPAGSWQNIFEQRIMRVVDTGKQLYQDRFQTKNWGDSSPENNCLIAQSIKGWALQVQTSAKVANIRKPGSVPQHILNQYDRNVERADRLVDDKCGGPCGGRGQALFAQWTQDLSAALGKYTRPSPATVLSQTSTNDLTTYLLQVWLYQEFWYLSSPQPGGQLKVEIRPEVFLYTLMFWVTAPALVIP